MLSRIINKVRDMRRGLAVTDSVSAGRVDAEPAVIFMPKTIKDWKPVDEQLYKSWIPHLILDGQLEGPTNGFNNVAPDITHFKIFSAEGCRRLCAELDAFDDWVRRYQVDVVPPNSMHRYGLVLAELGFESAIKELCEYLKPILAPMFPELGSDSLDEHHAFLVAYSNRDGDRDLGFHVDNSEVTLNITLEVQGGGGELYFHGRRCEQHRQMPHRFEEEVVFNHQTGGLLIHSGAHRHGVYPINNGHRRGIIIWLTSSAYRKNSSGACEKWCGDYAVVQGS